MTAPIRDMAGLVQALREAQDDRDISNETVDSISGLPNGYWSKIAAPTKIKGVGRVSLGPILGALGKAIVLVDDPDQIAKVRGRWVKRGPSGPRRNRHAKATMLKQDETLQQERKTRMQELGRMGGKIGGKRRLKTMSKRARQRAATHAARKRWAKRLAAAPDCGAP